MDNQTTSTRQRPKGWLYKRAPLWSQMPIICYVIGSSLPSDWPEWRGGMYVLGFGLYLWGWTGER